MTEYLSVEDVLALHVDIVRRTGGVPQGLRDRGGLESAVARPRFLAHYADADLFLQAAALATGISRAQAFVDGNKRTGYYAALTFLYRNGLEVAGDSLELARELERVAEPDVSDSDADDRIADWLRAHSQPLA